MTKHEVHRQCQGSIRQYLDEDGDIDVQVTAIDSMGDWQCMCGMKFVTEEAALEHIQE